MEMREREASWFNNFGHDTRLGVPTEEATRCCRTCNNSVGYLASARGDTRTMDQARSAGRFTCPECGRPDRHNVMPGAEFCSKAGDCRNECRIGFAKAPGERNAPEIDAAKNGA